MNQHVQKDNAHTAPAQTAYFLQSCVVLIHHRQSNYVSVAAREYCVINRERCWAILEEYAGQLNSF